MTNRLKVLFITPSYPGKGMPLRGIFIREYAKAVNIYNDVIVIHAEGIRPIRKGQWSVKLETDDALTEGIKTYRAGYPSIPKIGTLGCYGNILRAFKRAVSDGFKPDVIHAHIGTVGVPSVLIGIFYGLPVVITEHSGHFLKRDIGRVSIGLVRFAFKKADIVLPVSRMLQRCIQAYRVKAQFQVVPNVVDTELFYPPEPKPIQDPKRLLFVAAMGHGHKNKGISNLLQAMIRLRDKRDDWRLDIIGGGPAQLEYEQMAGDLGLGDYVDFHGAKPKSEVAEFMRRCDILVSSSYAETFGITLIEALTSGKPVVATNSGGPEDIVNDMVGKLVPRGDVGALVDAINYVFDHYEDYPASKIAQYARDRYSYEAVGKQLHKIYCTLCFRT